MRHHRLHGPRGVRDTAETDQEGQIHPIIARQRRFRSSCRLLFQQLSPSHRTCCPDPLIFDEFDSTIRRKDSEFVDYPRLFHAKAFPTKRGKFVEVTRERPGRGGDAPFMIVSNGGREDRQLREKENNRILMGCYERSWISFRSERQPPELPVPDKRWNSSMLCSGSSPPATH